MKLTPLSDYSHFSTQIKCITSSIARLIYHNKGANKRRGGRSALRGFNGRGFDDRDMSYKLEVSYIHNNWYEDENYGPTVDNLKTEQG